MIETSAEQLKRVKRLVEYDIERAFYHNLDLEKGLSLLEMLYEHLDIEWLIEQAERAQEFENRYDEQLEESQTTYNYFNSEIKRLRGTLGFYANKDNYSHGYHDLLGEIESDVEMDGGFIARQTLGEEEVN